MDSSSFLVKSSRRLLVLAAMASEEEAIRRVLGANEDIVISERLKLHGRKFTSEGHEIILLNCGIGPVKAGVATALVLEKMAIDAVLLFGVAGALVEKMEIGDLVLATHVFPHDSYFTGEEGRVPMVPGYPYISLPPEERKSLPFDTDARFRTWIEEHVLKARGIHYHSGVLASGSEFVGSSARKLELGGHEAQPIAVEMESAGIAVVSQQAGVPLIVAKTIADRVNPDHTISTDYNKFVNHAAANAAAVMQEVWRAWAAH